MNIRRDTWIMAGIGYFLYALFALYKLLGLDSQYPGAFNWLSAGVMLVVLPAIVLSLIWALYKLMPGGADRAPSWYEQHKRIVRDVRWVARKPRLKVQFVRRAPQDLRVGEAGWTVPWDTLQNGYTLASGPGGTSCVMIVRLADGLHAIDYDPQYSADSNPASNMAGLVGYHTSRVNIR